MAITKNQSTSIRKQANELKVYKKTVMTTFKHDLNSYLNPLVYAKWSVLEKKSNATSNSNIGSIKTALELKNLF